MPDDCSDWTEFFTDLNFTDFIFTDLIIHARGLSVTVMSVKIMSDKVLSIVTVDEDTMEQKIGNELNGLLCYRSVQFEMYVLIDFNKGRIVLLPARRVF